MEEELERRLRLAYIEGGEESSRERLGRGLTEDELERGLTEDELERVIRRFP